MRVISGLYKGRVIKTLEGKNTRPTSARVKEDMFNIINNYFIFENKISLDLFGGSGALTLEAVSRGIKKAYINDKAKPAVNIIKENLSIVDQSKIEITNLDWKSALFRYKGNIKFDIIFLDPPFAKHEYYYDFFKIINENDILNVNGIVSIQSEFKLNISEITNLFLLKEKEFKNKYYYLVRKEGDYDEKR